MSSKFVVVNFSHPLTAVAQAQILEAANVGMVGESFTEVKEILVVADVDTTGDSFETQVAQMFGRYIEIDREISEPIHAIVPPSLSYTAWILGQMVEEYARSWGISSPSVVVLRRVGIPPTFELWQLCR